MICDAFGALLASPGLFDDYTIKSTTTSIKFADQPFPLGLQNPIIPALDEIRREFDDPIDFILSIGCGRVAENDIPDLLRLGCLPPQVQAMKISPFSLQFYSALARYPNSWLGKATPYCVNHEHHIYQNSSWARCLDYDGRIPYGALLYPLGDLPLQN